ncbi:MAG: DUF4347 domain-containing protein, partial [Hyphomicrobiaceae bacterium]|nr:DUF4347 domain-containing protein [Hyphomicrobiaceae bacterium]
MFRFKRTPSPSKSVSDADRMIEATHRLQASSYRMLEQRMVFDGAAVDAVDGVINHHPSGGEPTSEPVAADQTKEVIDLLQAVAGAPVEPVASAHTIVFIDSRVQDVGVIMAAVEPGAEVVMLDMTQDGVTQIASILDGRSGIDAIHIVSHGTEGRLILGNGELTLASMQAQHFSALQTIGQALSAEGDILLYGCDFAAGTNGLAAVQTLSAITGADVAASTDDTGSDGRGGDWDLETQLGHIDVAAIDAPEWDGVLAPMVISVTSNPITSGGSGIGATGLWLNAGTIGGTNIDIRATVTTASTGASVSFARSGDDLWLRITGGTVTVRWEVFASGTNQTVIAVGDPNFRITDIDGDPNVALPFPQVEIEAVSPSLYGLTSYTLEAVTNLTAGVDGTNLVVRGTETQNSESTSLVAFDWTNVSSWQVTYTAVPGEGTRYFYHDGDGDLTFVDPRTNPLLGIDLDANDSTTTGSGYRTTYTAGATAIPVVDTDETITQHIVMGPNLGQANVVLTNAQAGDQLLVGGSSSSSGTINGLSYTVTNSAGQISVALSGTAPIATYEATLRQISFQNPSTSADLTDRTIQVSVSNNNFITTSNVAVATIVMNTPPVTHDPPGTPYVDPGDDTNIIVPATDAVTLTIDLDDAFTDPNGDPLTFTVGTLPSWASYNTSTHVLTVTPPADNTGNHVFDVTVEDNRGGRLDATLTIQPVNPGPTANADSTSTAFGIPVTVNLLANDTDPDGDTLTVTSASLTNASDGTLVFVPGTGWVFTPALGFSGSASISYTIQDIDGATSTGTHTVTVANAPPVTHDPPGTPYVDPGDDTNIIVPATDAVTLTIDLDDA